jgi:hypothetical protein
MDQVLGSRPELLPLTVAVPVPVLWYPIPERALCVKGRLASFCAHGSRESPIGLFSGCFSSGEDAVLELGCRGHFVSRLFAPFFSLAAAPLSIPS